MTAVSAPPSPRSPHGAGNPDDIPDVEESDKWCLEYLDIFYIPALKEAFDSDSNGLVNIREVNSYTKSRAVPEGWSILRRLAFSAAGWQVEMLRYRDKIYALLNTMFDFVDDVLPINQSPVRDALEVGLDSMY